MFALLRQTLAYRVQEKVLGGLKPAQARIRKFSSSRFSGVGRSATLGRSAG